MSTEGPGAPPARRGRTRKHRVAAVGVAVALLAAYAGRDAGASGSRATLPFPTFPTTTQATTTTTTAAGTPTQQALNSYNAFIHGEGTALVKAVAPFVTAIKQNNITTAKNDYAAAHFHWETLERLVRANFPQFKDSIDARVNDVPAANWTGFHRLEKGLFADNSLTGLSTIADKLTTDVNSFNTALQAFTETDPVGIFDFINEDLNQGSEQVIEGVEELYSHTDISDFQANFTGSRSAFEGAKQLINANEATALESRYVAVQGQLDGLKENNAIGNGFKLYNALSQDQVRNLSFAADALGEPLSNTTAEVAG